MRAGLVPYRRGKKEEPCIHDSGKNIQSQRKKRRARKKKPAPMRFGGTPPLPVEEGRTAVSNGEKGKGRVPTSKKTPASVRRWGRSEKRRAVSPLGGKRTSDKGEKKKKATTIKWWPPDREEKEKRSSTLDKRRRKGQGPIIEKEGRGGRLKGSGMRRLGEPPEPTSGESPFFSRERKLRIFSTSGSSQIRN